MKGRAHEKKGGKKKRQVKKMPGRIAGGQSEGSDSKSGPVLTVEGGEAGKKDCRRCKREIKTTERTVPKPLRRVGRSRRTEGGMGKGPRSYERLK